jgi:hypothetical protein
MMKFLLSFFDDLFLKLHNVMPLEMLKFVTTNFRLQRKLDAKSDNSNCSIKEGQKLHLLGQIYIKTLSHFGYGNFLIREELCMTSNTNSRWSRDTVCVINPKLNGVERFFSKYQRWSQLSVYLFGCDKQKFIYIIKYFDV